jgi:thermitase
MCVAEPDSGATDVGSQTRSDRPPAVGRATTRAGGAVKPHLVLRLRLGVRYNEVGSWLQLTARPDAAGPPFQPEIDALFLRHRVEVAIAHEYEPARTDGWSADERALGLDRRFRAVALTDRPFSPELVAELRALPVLERVDVGQVTSVALPLASSVSVMPSDWAAKAVSMPEAHAITGGDPGIKIAVLDTGVWPAHGEYRHRLTAGFDFVDIIDGADRFLGDRLEADADPTDPGVGHGSHVTGILVAKGERMNRGVAPECRVLPVRVLGALRQGDRLIGAGLVDNINAGIKWAVDHGALIINMSLGIRHEGGGLPHTDVIRYAAAKGVTVVAAAGNDGGQTLYYPGALPGVIAVGAVDRDDKVAAYSTWGWQVDLVAPGTEIWSSWLDGGYAFATGTSQATPFVTGAAALCQGLARRQRRRFRPAEVADLLRATADRMDQRFKNPHAGNGRLNIADALRLAQHRLETPERLGPDGLRPRREPSHA